MQFNSDVFAWLYEMYKRMGAKSPKFFQVVQAIGMAAALITGIPLAIQQLEMFTGLQIHLPDIVNHWVVRVVFWCGIMVKIVGKMPVVAPPETQPNKFPFTSKAVNNGN